MSVGLIALPILMTIVGSKLTCYAEGVAPPD